MKKIFTLLAGFVMAVSGFAQDLPAAVEWKAAKGSIYSTDNYKVELKAEDESPVITCEFLNFTGKNGGREATDFVWTLAQGNYATAWDITQNKVDGNGMEVQFVPNYGGTLEIVLNASLASNKSVNMYYNEDPEKTINGFYGETEIVSGDADHVAIPGSGAIKFTVNKGRVYNFYCAGTKWQFKSFKFTPTDNDEVADEEKDKNVLVVSPEGEEDHLYFALQGGFEAEYVKSISALEEGKTLSDYDVILVSNKVTEDNDGELRKAVAYYPMVNLSSELVKAWNLGTVANSEYNYINVSDENAENALYADITLDEGALELVAEGVLPVVTPGDYLKA